MKNNNNINFNNIINQYLEREQVERVDQEIGPFASNKQILLVSRKRQAVQFHVGTRGADQFAVNRMQHELAAKIFLLAIANKNAVLSVRKR
jgi:hypothetical protein